MHFFKNLSIKVKVSAGFGLMQLIIVVISLSALMSLSTLQNDLANMAGEIQPEVLSGLIDQMNATEVLLSAMLVFGLVLGVVIAWGILKMILIPLQTALDVMTDIVDGEGDLTRRLDDSSDD